MAKGGRGGRRIGANNISAARVKMGDYEAEYYFMKAGSKNFFQRGLGGTPEPTPNNMSKNAMVSRMQKNGAEVSVMSKSEIKKNLESHKKYREEMEKFLDKAYVSDRDFKKGSREERTGNRANRRRR